MTQGVDDRAKEDDLRRILQTYRTATEYVEQVEARGKFMALAYPLVLAIACRFCRGADHDAAEDMASTVLLDRIVPLLDRYNPARGMRLRSYIQTAAIRGMLDVRRQEARTQLPVLSEDELAAMLPLLVDDGATSPLDRLGEADPQVILSAAADEAWRTVRQALSGDEYQVVEGQHRYAKTTAEIAHDMGRQRKAVSELHQSALHKLRGLGMGLWTLLVDAT